MRNPSARLYASSISFVRSGLIWLASEVCDRRERLQQRRHEERLPARIARLVDRNQIIRIVGAPGLADAVGRGQARRKDERLFGRANVPPFLALQFERIKRDFRPRQRRRVCRQSVRPCRAPLSTSGLCRVCDVERWSVNHAAENYFAMKISLMILLGRAASSNICCCAS